MHPLQFGAPFQQLPPEDWRKILRDPDLRLVSRWSAPELGLEGAVSAWGEVYAFRTPSRKNDLTMRQVERVLKGLPLWQEPRAWCIFLDDKRDPPRHSSHDWEVVRSGSAFRALIGSMTSYDVLVKVSWDQHLANGDPDTGESLLRWLLEERPGKAELCRMTFHTADELASARLQDLWSSFLATPKPACGSPLLHLRAHLEEGGLMAERALMEALDLGFFS